MKGLRKYKNGDLVTTKSQSLKMIVVEAILCLKGWRYKLAFPKKNGGIDKRRECRFYFETDIN